MKSVFPGFATLVPKDLDIFVGRGVIEAGDTGLMLVV